MKKNKVMKTINSTRKYVIVGFDHGHELCIKMTIDEILQEDTELAYTIQDDIDEILDMRVGDIIYTSLARDNKHSLGLIKRIS